MGNRENRGGVISSASMSLADIAKRLHNDSIERIVAMLSERRVAPLRVSVLGFVVVWVTAWHLYGPQPVLVKDAHKVYLWALTVFLASIGWYLLIRFEVIKMRAWVDVAGTVANYIIIAVLTKHAFLLLITLEALLPFLAIMIGVKYSRRWFNVGVATSFAVLLWSAPPEYWVHRPAYLVYAIVLTVGLPLLIGRIFSAVREISLQALEAMDTQNRFIGAMSHELRTPLNVINNAIALIDRKALDGDQRTLLELGEANAKALTRRVNNVLEITKNRAVGVKLKAENIDMRALMALVRDANMPDAFERDVAFSVDVSEGVPLAVCGDQGRIEQVLSNLAANAIKYTPAGGHVAVTLHAGEIRTEGLVDLVCRVADTGVGIPEEEKVRIFDAFYQVSGGEARMQGGVGLGLFIVRSVTEQLGGSLTVENNAGGGTLFTWRVTLPIAQASASDLMQALPDLLREHRACNQPLRCLVIDDHAANVDIMQHLLGRAGYEVCGAGDGPAGLRALDQGEFDIAFLDLHMPGMSGWDVLDVFMRNPSRRAVPVVVLSADADPAVASRAVAMGAAAFLGKPVSARRLLDTILRLCGQTGIAGADIAAEITLLGEMRQIGDAIIVGRLLRQVSQGLSAAWQGLERAIASDATEQALHYLHRLRNEFGVLGFSESVAYVARLKRQAAKMQTIADDVGQLKSEIERALGWIAAQPEFAKYEGLAE